jgi:predicted phosphodiesterase
MRRLVLGHTHKPWIHSYGGVLFVKCGSVGEPKDGDPPGAFAVQKTDDTGVTATIERTTYDVTIVAQEILTTGLPGETGRQAPPSGMT